MTVLEQVKLQEPRLFLCFFRGNAPGRRWVGYQSGRALREKSAGPRVDFMDKSSTPGPGPAAPGYYFGYARIVQFEVFCTKVGS